MLNITPYGNRDIQALGALRAGIATHSQQLYAFKFITETLCKLDGVPFDPENQHKTSFMNGKRMVAVEMIAIAKAKQQGDKDDGRHNSGRNVTTRNRR